MSIYCCFYLINYYICAQILFISSLQYQFNLFHKSALSVFLSPSLAFDDTSQVLDFSLSVITKCGYLILRILQHVLFPFILLICFHSTVGVSGLGTGQHSLHSVSFAFLTLLLVSVLYLLYLM